MKMMFKLSLKLIKMLFSEILKSILLTIRIIVIRFAWLKIKVDWEKTFSFRSEDKAPCRAFKANLTYILKTNDSNFI